MKAGGLLSFSFVLLVLLLFVGVLTPVPADAAFLKKQFSVRRDQGHDILCDPYVVQKDDFVTKLFKQRGEISHEDFPKFLGIFKRINPEINNIDKIYPGRRILIPLKSLPPGTLEGQSTGTVTLPIIMVSDLPELMVRNSSVYEVRGGDTVWDLVVDRFGGLGQREYLKLKELVKYMNPGLRSLNFIDVGDKIRLPESSVRNTLWYGAIFDESGDVLSQQPFAESSESREEAESFPAGASAEPARETGQPATPSSPDRPFSLYEKAERILNGDLMAQGDFFFPRAGLPDYRLALDQTPIMALPGGLRLLFAGTGELSESAVSVIRQSWRNLAVIRMEPGFSLRDIFRRLCPALNPEGCTNKVTFNDKGVSVTVRGEFIYDRPAGDGKVCLNFIEHEKAQTPIEIRRYLGHHWIVVEDWIYRPDAFAPATPPRMDPLVLENARTLTAGSPAGFVRRFLLLLGYDFQANVAVSFPYAGFQVRATTNKVTMGPQSEVLIDFGDLQGDAIKALESIGLDVIQIQDGMDYYEIARHLLSEFSIDQERPPLFWAAERRRIDNISIRIPGIIITIPEKPGDARKILITDGELPPEIQYFLSCKEFELIQVAKH